MIEHLLKYDMEKIEKKINSYIETTNIRVSKREQWNIATKECIYNQLLRIKNLANLDWQVFKNEIINNNECVYLSFNKSSSGIVIKSETSTKAYTKYGGGLLFSQAYNGDVFVIISYPHIEEVIPEIENKLLDKISPLDINEVYVNNKVEEFFDEIIKWENSVFYNTNKLGFKQN